MQIVSLALGGCLKREPVRYGITEDTGGHISYVLGEMAALARLSGIEHAEIVTRLFDAPALGPEHALASERLGDRFSITRIDSGNRAYLAKEALAHDRENFTRALLANLRARRRLPDLIHAHFADAAAIASAVRAELGIPFVYTAHSLGIDKLSVTGRTSPELQGRIAEETRAIGTADAIIASSRDECERQLPAYPTARLDRIHRLRPGVDLSPVYPSGLAAARTLIAPFLRDPDKPIVLAIARAVEKKNLRGLIDAFAGDTRLRDGANLVILAGLRDGLATGEAEQRAVLAQLFDCIDRHDLYGKVAYPPRHSRDQVRGLYALAAASGGVFVNPALSEPYGLTLTEAAVHGLPVIATRNGGPNDIVRELGHGLLVDPLDQQAIAAAIGRIIGDRACWQRFSTSGLANVQHMTWERYASGFLRIAREIRRPASVSLRDDARPDGLLLCDIDNTLTGCRSGARAFTRFLGRYRRTAFGVATGRSIIEAQRVLREWDLPMPRVWITSVGSEIYWSGPDGLIADAAYSRLIEQGWNAETVAQVAQGIPGLHPQDPIEQRAFKRSWFTEHPGVLGRFQSALDEAGVSARLVLSHDDHLDAVPRRAGKAAAMHFVASRLGLPDERVFAVGDSGNDADMLAACRNAVLVANHSAEVSALRALPNVYVARRGHARGALEGFLHHGVHRSAAKAVTA